MKAEHQATQLLVGLVLILVIVNLILLFRTYTLTQRMYDETKRYSNVTYGNAVTGEIER